MAFERELNIFLRAKDQTGRAVKVVNSNLDKMQKVATATSAKMTRSFDKAKRSLSGIGNKFKSVFSALNRFKLGIVALGASFGLAVREALSFERGLTKVQTLVRNNTLVFGKFQEQLKILSKQTGQTKESLTTGLFDIISATIKTSDAMAVLKTATDLAIAGFTTTDQAVKAVITVFQTFGDELNDVSEASDALFSIQKRGRLTVEDVARSFGGIAAVAKSLGVGLNATGAAFAAISRSGEGAELAITQLRQFLLSFVGASDEAKEAALKYGVVLDVTAIQGDRLVETIQKLKKATIEDTSVIFNEVRALRGFNNLAGRSTELLTDLSELQQKTGSTLEALADVTDRSFQKFARFKEVMKDLGETIAKETLPALEGIVKVVEGTIKGADKAGGFFSEFFNFITFGARGLQKEIKNLKKEGQIKAGFLNIDDKIPAVNILRNAMAGLNKENKNVSDSNKILVDSFSLLQDAQRGAAIAADQAAVKQRELAAARVEAIQAASKTLGVNLDKEVLATTNEAIEAFKLLEESGKLTGIRFEEAAAILVGKAVPAFDLLDEKGQKFIQGLLDKFPLLQEMFNQMTNSIQDTTTVLDKSLQELGATLDSFATGSVEEAIAALKVLEDSGKVTGPRLAEAWEAAKNKILPNLDLLTKEQKKFFDEMERRFPGVKKATTKAGKEFDGLSEKILNVRESLTKTFSDILFNTITGKTKKFGDSIKDIFKNIGNQILRSITDRIAGGITGSLSGGGTGGGGILSSIGKLFGGGGGGGGTGGGGILSSIGKLFGGGTGGGGILSSIGKLFGGGGGSTGGGGLLSTIGKLFSGGGGGTGGGGLLGSVGKLFGGGASILGKLFTGGVGAPPGAGIVNAIAAFAANKLVEKIDIGKEGGGNQQIGSLIGGTIGSLFTPLGTFAGAAIGGLAGSFVGPSRKDRKLSVSAFDLPENLARFNLPKGGFSASRFRDFGKKMTEVRTSLNNAQQRLVTEATIINEKIAEFGLEGIPDNLTLPGVETSAQDFARISQTRIDQLSVLQDAVTTKGRSVELLQGTIKTATTSALSDAFSEVDSTSGFKRFTESFRTSILSQIGTQLISKITELPAVKSVFAKVIDPVTSFLSSQKQGEFDVAGFEQALKTSGERMPLLDNFQALFRRLFGGLSRFESNFLGGPPPPPPEPIAKSIRIPRLQTGGRIVRSGLAVVDAGETFSGVGVSKNDMLRTIDTRFSENGPSIVVDLRDANINLSSDQNVRLVATELGEQITRRVNLASQFAR